MAAKRVGVWAQGAQDFLNRYTNARRGRGGFPTSMDRLCVSRVLDERDALLEALKEAWPSNLLAVPDHLPDDFVFPVDMTAGELRKIAAAIRQAEGGE